MSEKVTMTAVNDRMRVHMESRLTGESFLRYDKQLRNCADGSVVTEAFGSTKEMSSRSH